jgi:hypothetical protein
MPIEVYVMPIEAGLLHSLMSVQVTTESENLTEKNLAVLLARQRVSGYLAEPWRVKVQKVAA